MSNVAPFPQILEQVRDFLINNPVTIASKESNGDGRHDSIKSEKLIIDSLKIKFPNIIHEPTRARFWYDFCINYNGEFFPVNIKVTSGYHKNTSDNTGQMLAMVYAFTNLKIEEIHDLGRKPRTKTSYMNNLLTTRVGDMSRDYYYLVINKDNSSEVMIVSMKNMIVSETNEAKRNLPFQTHWGQNHKNVARTFNESYNYLMSAYRRNYRYFCDDYIDIDNFKEIKCE